MSSGQHSRPLAGGQRPVQEPTTAAIPETEYASRLTPTAKRKLRKPRSTTTSACFCRKGTTFGCLPQSPIDTQLVGSVTCTADEEVRSADGTNRLIDKGAFVTGEIQRGLGLGQDRAFILWSRVRSGRMSAPPSIAPVSMNLGRWACRASCRSTCGKRSRPRPC